MTDLPVLVPDQQPVTQADAERWYQRLAAMRADLELASAIPDMKEIRGRAESLRFLAKTIGMGLEAQNEAANVKLRCEREMGTMLKDDPTVGSGKDSTLESFGINGQQSHRWQLEAGVPEDVFEGYVIGAFQDRVELTSAGLIKIARRLGRPAGEAVLPTGRYRTLVVDPPWQMQKIERDVRPKQGGFDYPTMTEDELADLPVADWAEPDAHLYLWTTHKHLPIALRLAEAWDFKYECLMTWVKPVGFTPFSWMRSTEHVLFCRRGNLDLQRLGMRLDFAYPVTGHSRKPSGFYTDVVEAASPGPYYDVFARERRSGWDAYGDEVAA